MASAKYQDIDWRITRAREMIAEQRARVAAQQLVGPPDPKSQELLAIFEDGLEWLLEFRSGL